MWSLWQWGTQPTGNEQSYGGTGHEYVCGLRSLGFYQTGLLKTGTDLWLTSCRTFPPLPQVFAFGMLQNGMLS